MKILFVFDNFINVKKAALPYLNAGDTVRLYPLTSKVSVTDALAKKAGTAGCNVTTVRTAGAINSAADRMREKYIRFVAELPGRIQRRSRGLKELFAIDNYATLWWLSLISEKNTYKSDVFNRLAQLDSIVDAAKTGKIDRIIFGCRSEKLKNALREYCSKARIKFEALPVMPLRDLKLRVKEYQKFLYLKHLVILARWYFKGVIAKRTRRAKKLISPLKRSIPQNGNPLLIITPYPNIDESSAQDAVFKDKFYMHLQKSLEDNKRNIIWTAMYAEGSNISYEKAFEYARRFIKNGYTIFFPEEFNSLTGRINAVLTILKSGFKFLMLEKDIRAAHDFDDYNAYPLFRDDWYSSFAGKTGYEGIIYYYMFRTLLKKLKAEKCLYHCEMHAWEKALIFARDRAEIEMPLYGYYGGAASKMLLGYANDPREVSETAPYAMPKPDKIICNGRLPYNYMRESGWPKEKLPVVEAIRYSHLKKYLDLKPADKKRNIVLLVLSVNPEESASILAIAYEALKDLKDIEVWVKPHPFLNLERFFDVSGISREDFHFQLKEGPIEDFLSEARIAIVGESTATLEALAFDCEVIVVNVPEWINMSPLKYIKTEMSRSADSPEELRQMVVDIFKEGHKPRAYAAEARRIINDFFYLNRDSDSPENFMELLRSENG